MTPISASDFRLLSDAEKYGLYAEAVRAVPSLVTEERPSGYTLSGATFYRKAIMDAVGDALTEDEAKKIIDAAEEAAAKEAPPSPQPSDKECSWTDRLPWPCSCGASVPLDCVKKREYMNNG